MRAMKSIGVFGVVCMLAACGATDGGTGTETPVGGEADTTSTGVVDEDASGTETGTQDTVTKPEDDTSDLTQTDTSVEEDVTPEEDVAVEEDVAPEEDAATSVPDAGPEEDATLVPDAGPDEDAAEEDTTEADVVAPECDPALCDDGDPCTDDVCVDGACESTGIDGCCALDTECDDQNACTADACIANACVNTAADDCCALDTDCDDANDCTADACIAGACVNTAADDCCASDNDCADDDQCTTDTCEDGVCVNKAQPNCCVENEECADDDPCTKEACIEGECVVKPLLECCVEDGDCDDENACTIDACDLETGLCAEPVAADGCCVADADCADDNPCTKAGCIDNACGEPLSIEDGLTCGDGLICVDGLCEEEPVCGDGAQGFGEACDDGNLKPGDGCSMTCTVEHHEPGEIIFTEFMANPASVNDDMGEWIEVYNTTDGDIDINGWRLSEANGNPHVISAMAPVVIPAGGYRVLTLTCGFETNGGVKPVYCYEGAVVDDLVNPGIFLNNDADALSLSWNGVEIDAIAYDVITGWPSGNGASTQLASTALDMTANDAASAWCLSTIIFGDGDLGSPGKGNSDCGCGAEALCDDGNDCTTDACDAGVCVSTLVEGCCLDDDHCDDDNVCTEDTCSGETLTCEPSVAIDGCCLEDAECDDSNPCTIDACTDDACAEAVSLDDGVSCGDALICVEGTCVDEPVCGDNVQGFGEACDDGNTKPGDGCSMVCTVEFHEPGEIIVSEIMSDPSAVNDEVGEWFEVYNTTDGDIDINGWTLSDTTDNVHVITSATPVVVPAMGYLALTLTCDAALNGGITPGYCYEGDVVDDLVNPGVFLNNDNDALHISWNSVVIDTVMYDAEMGWLLEGGASLQLDSGALDGVANDAPGVWCLSTATYGDGDLGTPGTANAECGCPEGTPCDDGNACTTDDLCVAGECVGGGTLSCTSACSCTESVCDPDMGCMLGGPVTDHDFEAAALGLMPGCWTTTAGTWGTSADSATSGTQALAQTEAGPSTLSVAMEGHMWSASEALTLSSAMRSDNVVEDGSAAHGLVVLYQDPQNYYALRRSDDGAGHAHHLVSVVEGVETVLAESEVDPTTTSGAWGDFSVTVSADGAAVQFTWDANGWTGNATDTSTWTMGRLGLLADGHVHFDDVMIAGERVGPTLCEAGTICDAGCDATDECADGQSCIGKLDYPGTFGKCTDTTTPDGSDDSCDLEAPCGPGLACLGEYAWGGGGWCVAEWFAKTYVSHETVAIPDMGGMEASTSVFACGLATVPVDVYVTVDIDHPRPADLSVILEDPNGQQGTVALDGKVTQTAVQAFPGDDMVGGMWTLRVTDTVEGETGTLNGWSVYILSNWD